jgi:cation:H+ antiporter
MLAVMAIMTIPTLLRGKLARWQGFTLLAIYFAYIATQFIFVQNVA